MSVMRTKSIEQSMRDGRRAGVPAQEAADRAGPHGLRHRRDHRRRHLHASPGGRPRTRRAVRRALVRRRRDLLRAGRALLRRVRLDDPGISGSAYTFSYASLGEIVAWIIGWDLLLELMLGASVVAQGWSAYLGVLPRPPRHHHPASRWPTGRTSTCRPSCWSSC